MTIGPALGHGIYIDREGLNQALNACLQRGSIRLIDRHDAEFEGIVGSVSNFRIEGDQLRGDAELFKEHPMRGRILEIAEKIPNEFGLSIESFGAHLEDPDNKDRQLFRCDDVDAVALVPRPAANKNGLFSARRVDTEASVTTAKMSKLKTALTKFAKALKLEEGDAADNIIDEVVDAIEDGHEDEDPGNFDARLRKLEDAINGADEKDESSYSARLKKLEEKEPEELSEEEKQEEEDRMEKLAEKASEKHITKLAKSIGLSKAPGGGEGFVVLNDTKSKFESAISAKMKAGAKDRGVAIARLAQDDPKLYSEARTAGLY